MTELVILVGGKGTRLGKFTKKIPKPLLKIDKNKTFLDFLLSKLVKYNFKKIYLLCSFKKDLFFKKYHLKKIHNSKLICVDEGKPKDTGGALYPLRKIIKNNFVLVNGDTYFDFNYNLFKNIIPKNIIGSIAITDNFQYKKNIKINNIFLNKFGFLNISKSETNLMNAGIYFFKKKIFKYVQNKKLSLENDILPNLIRNNKIKGIYSNNKFIDIGYIKNLLHVRKKTNILKQKCVFLDRDGVINKVKKNSYIKKFVEFKFLPGVIKSIKILNEKDYLVIIITNQAGVGKSIMSEKQLNLIHQKMMKIINLKNGGIINDIYYSPYYKNSKYLRYRQNCKNRKPNIGMFKMAIDKWNIDINNSFFIGDSVSDMLAAKKLNLKFYYKEKISLDKQIIKIVNNE